MTGNVADLDDFSADQQLQIQNRTLAEAGKLLAVSVMGQIGVGKSSLLNGLFGASLELGDVRPTTKIPEPAIVPGSIGYPLTFSDMPGLGESVRADKSYLAMYRRQLSSSDVVLWAIHADTRSMPERWSRCLQAFLQKQRCALLGKMAFVLTKADLIRPPPWIYLRDGEAGIFAVSKSTGERVAEKARYYQDTLIRPYGGLQAAETYQSGNFTIDDPPFDADDYHIRFQGFMSENLCAHYSTAYPACRDVFERLRDNHHVILVSALFRYDLTSANDSHRQQARRKRDRSLSAARQCFSSHVRSAGQQHHADAREHCRLRQGEGDEDLRPERYRAIKGMR